MLDVENKAAISRLVTTHHLRLFLIALSPLKGIG